MSWEGWPTLAVVVPCYNERLNVAPLVASVDAALGGSGGTKIAWEIIFVDDDSPDGTSDAARAIAVKDHRVRVIRRIGRRGLSSAVIEGALATSAEFIAVIDGDLQHDETRLPLMVQTLRAGADLAVGSRHLAGGDAGGLASPFRKRLSRSGIRLAQVLTGSMLSDPMSGFFMLRRHLFEQLAPTLTGQGFKILLDLILAASGDLKIVEVPYRFRPRRSGESKLDPLVIAQFGGLLIDKILRGVVPSRFVAFALVGSFGVLVNLAVMAAVRTTGLDFSFSQTVGTIAAMVVNFELNNRLTYRTARLRGSRYWRGLAVFMLVCGLGAIANIGIARMLYADNTAGLLASAAGGVVGVVWNYAVSSTLVWRRA